MGLKFGGIKKITYPISFLLGALLFLGSPVALAQPQTIQGPGVVVRSFQEDLSRGTLTLKLDRPVQTGRPVFRYLPGANGETILSADFEGLQWVAPTAVFRPEYSAKDKAKFIREVHLGQWMVSPAIMRLSFISANPQLLKQVSIASGEGVLKISWPVANSVPPVSPVAASSVAKSESLPLASRSKKKQVQPVPKQVSAAEEPALAQLPNSGASGWMKRWKSKAANFFSFDGTAVSEQGQAELKAEPKPQQNLGQKSEPRPAPKLAEKSVPRPAPAIKGEANTAGSTAGEPSSKPSALKPSAKTDLLKVGSVKPVVAPSALVSSALPKPRQAEEGAAIDELFPASVDKNGQLAPAPSVAPESAPSPIITYEASDTQGGSGKLAIFRIEQGAAISFKSFRLHNPERYVVDIKGARSILNSQLPEVGESPLVNAIRVGVLEQDQEDGRLVLELKDESVSVEEVFNEGATYLTVTLGKGLGLNSAGILRNGAGAITGGAVAAAVPRVSGEPVIVVDAGHGGHDPGAMRGDVQEKELTLGIAFKLKKALEAKGARVVMTRSDDTFVSLEDRVKITNSVQPDVFISVHINSLESTSDIYGVETYFQNSRSKTLADKVQNSLVANLAVPDRFVRKARFYVINHTPVPAILAEVGYITNKNERARLISSDYQGKVAGALARGVMLYLQDEKYTANIASKSQSRNSQVAANPGTKSVK